MKRALQSFVVLVVLMIGAVTAVANFHYGMLAGHGQERYVYAIGGTVLDVVKTLLPTILGTFLIGPLTLGTFFGRLAGWTFWAALVVYSMVCALGLYAIQKEAAVGDLQGQKALYQQLVTDKPKKEARVAALQDARVYETVEGEIAALRRDRAFSSSSECRDVTAKASRELCAKIDRLTAELPSSPRASDLQQELQAARIALAEVETKLAGINMNDIMKEADPASKALANLLGWDVETVKARFAFLIAALFECIGLLPVFVLGGHAPVPRLDPAPRKRKDEPSLAGPALAPAASPADLKTELDLVEENSLVATWANTALVKRKGSFVPSSDVRGDFEAWCRSHGHDLTAWNPTAFGKEMTRLGFKGRKRSGVQVYPDLALVPKSRDLKLAVSN